MPEVTDENKFNTWHVPTVNEDKGEARSDRRQPPIYIVITESESSLRD